MKVFTQFNGELKSVWESVVTAYPSHVPYSTFAWHKAWFETLGKGFELFVFVNTDTSIVIPLVVKDGTAHFCGGEECGDYLDAIGPNEKKSNAWNHALKLLAAQRVTFVDLRNIPSDSNTIEIFKKLPNARIEQEDTTPIVPLPESFDAYLASLDRKNRHELRRKVRRFDESYPESTISVLEGKSTDIPLLVKLMKLDADKHKFLTQEMEQFFLRLPEIVGDNLLQINLVQNTDVVATTLAFRHSHTLLLYNSGYVHSFDGAGFYLKAKVIEWAINQQFHHYNLLQGNERYKYELGGNDYFVYQIRMKL